ncbi:MAG: hypothetical protein QOI20_3044, partial [Acidimicrobiaceae bacterium]|nr:hypothetical protein [Acidimicrobiaceae bacterium]
GVSEAQQADYFTRSVAWFAAKHPYVTQLFWYNDRDRTNGTTQDQHYGLLHTDYSPKPAYNAIKAMLTGGGNVQVVTPPAAPSTGTPAPAAPATPATASPTARRKGYKLIAADGRIFSYSSAAAGSIANFAVAPGHHIVASAGTKDGGGSWSVTDNGAVFSTGNAPNLGGIDHLHLNRPIVGMAGTPTGRGYWLVATDGGIFSFGDAAFFGSTGGMPLNKPIVGMAATPTGRGYWLVATDGGVFAYGDARFFGSTGGLPLNKPIVGMAAAPNGNGYWMVAADGGIFAYNAPFLGSTGAIHLNRPIVGMVATPSGGGYWFAAADGGIFAYGDADFLGSAADTGATFTAMVPAA